MSKPQIRTYTCIECGKPFESADEVLQWQCPKCPDCDHDYGYYGSDEQDEYLYTWEDNTPVY